MTSNADADLYRAAVGDKKADYYLPLFLRFDAGDGRASWNWPALFVPFFWLLYRKMYGYALAYFVGWPILLTIIMVLLTIVLQPDLATLVYWAIVIVGRVLLAVFANALYHVHIRKVIAQQQASAPSREALVQRLIGRTPVVGTAVILAIVAFSGVALIGILAAIAIPAYQDYTIRSQITEGLNLASSVKAAVAQSYAAQGAWPVDLQDAGIDAEDLSGKYVESIEVRDGAVFILYGKDAHPLIAGRSLALQPSSAADGDVTWSCGYAADSLGDVAAGGTDVASKYLPSACRPARR